MVYVTLISPSGKELTVVSTALGSILFDHPERFKQ